MSTIRIDTAIVIVAAGSGTRLRADAPKAFVGIDERPILAHALDGVFAASPAQVIVVAPEDHAGEALTIAHAAADEADERDGAGQVLRDDVDADGSADERKAAGQVPGGAAGAAVADDEPEVACRPLEGAADSARSADERELAGPDPGGAADAAVRRAVADVASVAAGRGGRRRDLVMVVTGRDTRQRSVAAGLARVWPTVDVVLVHDAARALTPPEVIDRVADRVRETGHGVIPALDVIDTIKRIDGSRIAEAVDRSDLAAAQTPQGFRRDVLVAAYERAAEDFTDDAALVADAGHDVLRVEGSALGFKITTPADLARARDLVGRVRRGTDDRARNWRSGPNRQILDEIPDPRQMPLPRVGVGTDVHGYGGDGSLWLAGLEWPDEPALSGHSDGDAVAHAIVDAVLNAAGLGDIGTHFGTDRPEFAGAHADAFLAETARILRDAGWRVGNVSVQLQAQRPTFAPRRAEAERALSAALGAPVSVSATTTDGLGFTGSGAGIQVFAVALVGPLT